MMCTDAADHVTSPDTRCSMDISRLAGSACLHRRPWPRALVAAITGMVLVNAYLLTPAAGAQLAPSLTLSPTSGAAGTSLTVRGFNFPRRQGGQLYWASSASGMPRVTTNGNGTFSVTLTVPRLAPGTYAVSAIVAGQTAGTPYTIRAPAEPPSTPGVYLGVWQPGAPGDMTRLAAFEADAGKRVAIVHWFQGWGAANAALDTNLLRAVAEHGSAPMITWEPWGYTRGIDQPTYSLATIAAGRHDAYIRSWAQGLASYGGPVLLRFAHEMNLRHYPWSVGVNGNTAADYIVAWRHIHAIFAAAGATNVQWVWSPSVAWDAQTDFRPMFPGDTYLHWVALDGYNNAAWGGWQSFSQIFAASYQTLTSFSTRPVMIAETSSGESGGSKADWIRDALGTQIPTLFPRIRALIWFNENKEVDWRIQSSESARRAFADAVALPRYLATWP